MFCMTHWSLVWGFLCMVCESEAFLAWLGFSNRFGVMKWIN
jgi:hypothetical protein